MEFVRLGDEERKRFDKEGYLVIRNALPSDIVPELISAGDAIFREIPSQKRQQKAGGLWDSYRNCLSLSEVFIPLMTHSLILSYVVQLLGPNLHMMTSHLIYRFPDPPGTAPDCRVFGWHRDIANMPGDLGHAAIPRLMIKAAFYLTDVADTNCGATLFLPGSNHLKTELSIPSGKVDPEGTVEPPLSAGDCVLFENRTWHAVGANLGETTRKSLMFAYGYRWLKAVDYVTQPKEVVEKLDEIGKFLVGEHVEGRRKFRIGGGQNPLKEWAEGNGFYYMPK